MVFGRPQRSGIGDEREAETAFAIRMQRLDIGADAAESALPIRTVDKGFDRFDLHDADDAA
jgi:hypothetical protein